MPPEKLGGTGAWLLDCRPDSIVTSVDADVDSIVEAELGLEQILLEVENGTTPSCMHSYPSWASLCGNPKTNVDLRVWIIEQNG